MTNLVLLFSSSFMFVFLKAFQQRNVAFSNISAIVPVSMMMACVEVYVVVNIAARGFHPAVILSIGLGSGIGAVSAVILHKKLFKGVPK